MLTAIAFITVASLQSPAQAALTKKISYTSVAAPAKKVIEELADRTGVKLIVSPKTSGDVLAIQVHDVTVRDLMDKIAATIHGEWSPENGGFRLIRTPASEDQELKDEIAVTTVAFKRAIDKRLATAGVLKPFDANAAKSLVTKLDDLRSRTDSNGSNWRIMRSLSDDGPAGRAMTRLLAVLDPNLLAKVPADYRTVFSNRPTRMQSPLPAAISGIAKDFMRDQNLWAEAVKPISREQSGMYVDLFNYRASLTAEPRALLAVTKEPFGTGASLELMFADESGRIIGRATASLSPDFEEFQKEAMGTSGDNGIKIELSPLTARYMKLFSFFGANAPAEPAPLDPDLLQVILNPEKSDPLSMTSTEALFGVASARKANLVANLPDVLFAFNFPFIANSSLTVGSVLAMCKTIQTEVTIADGWMTVMPKYPALSRNQRIDRNALGALLRSAQKNGRISMDDMAQYAQICPVNQVDLMGSPLAMLFDPAISGLMDNNLLNLYRFYGAMSPAQRAAMRAPEPASFPLSALTPKQAEALRRIVYGPQPNFSYTTANEMLDEGGFLMNTISQEATQALPDGLPKDGFFLLQFSERDVVVPSAGSRDMDADDLGNTLFQQEHPELFPQEAQYHVALDKIKMAHRSAINFEFSFNRQLSLHRELKDISKRGPQMTFDQLPEEFRKRVQAAKDRAQQMWKDYKPGQQGTVQPPPGR